MDPNKDTERLSISNRENIEKFIKAIKYWGKNISPEQAKKLIKDFFIKFDGKELYTDVDGKRRRVVYHTKSTDLTDNNIHALPLPAYIYVYALYMLSDGKQPNITVDSDYQPLSESEFEEISKKETSE
jgi:hypothetical protein